MYFLTFNPINPTCLQRTGMGTRSAEYRGYCKKIGCFIIQYCIFVLMPYFLWGYNE